MGGSEQPTGPQSWFVHREEAKKRVCRLVVAGGL